jgi:hypothetical protein
MSNTTAKPAKEDNVSLEEDARKVLSRQDGARFATPTPTPPELSDEEFLMPESPQSARRSAKAESGAAPSVATEPSTSAAATSIAASDQTKA